MSNAQVQFETLDFDPAGPGQEDRFGFKCPKYPTNRCEGLIILDRIDAPHDPQGQHGGIPQWGWNNNREAPTFTPSINCGMCGWHGYIQNGRCVDTNKNEEPEP